MLHGLTFTLAILKIQSSPGINVGDGSKRSFIISIYLYYLYYLIEMCCARSLLISIQQWPAVSSGYQAMSSESVQYLKRATDQNMI